MRDLSGLSIFTLSPGTAEHDRAEPERRRPVVELATAGLGALTLLLWPAPGPLLGFDRVALPLLLGLLLLVNLPSPSPLMGAALVARRQARGSLALAWLYVLGKLAVTLLLAPQAQLEVLAPLLPWMLTLLMLHSWRLPVAEARVLTGMVLAASLGVLAGLLVQGPQVGSVRAGTAAVTLVQGLLAGVALLVGQRDALRGARRQGRRRAWGALDDGPRDVLTGLPGHETMQWALRQVSQRRPAGVAVAVVRLDHAARLRLERGEVFMERVTAHVARTLVEGLRDEDLVGRAGPDQFMLLLRVPDVWAGRAVGERLRLRVAARPVEGVSIKISVGVAQLGAGEALDALAQAQQALAPLENVSQGPQLPLGDAPAQARKLA